MGKFSIESMTENLLLKVVKEFFFCSDTVRSSSSTVSGCFCLFHRLTAFSFLKCLVFLLRHLIGRHEDLVYLVKNGVGSLG